MTNVMLKATMPAGEVAIAVLLGVGIVFVGLVCIIGLCYLMSLVVNKVIDRVGKKKPQETAPASSAPNASSGVIANRQEILAAVCAAVAEEEGTDISAIRVISFKKI